MAGIKYIRVRPDWHRLDTKHGTFFGYTRDQVEEKAHAAEVRAARDPQYQDASARERDEYHALDDFSHLPPGLREAARTEQQSLLAQRDSQRGTHRCRSTPATHAQPR